METKSRPQFELEQKIEKRIIRTLTQLNPTRDSDIWLDLLIQIKLRTPRGRYYVRRFFQHYSNEDHPRLWTAITEVAHKLILEISHENQTQLNIFDLAKDEPSLIN